MKRAINKKVSWQIATVALAITGAIVANAVSIPLPWMLGPLFTCLALSAWGAPVQMPKAPQPYFRAILGVAIGANFTPEIIERIGGIGFSLAFLPFYVAFVVFICYQVLHRLLRLDKITALFGSIPGGLIEMILMGSRLGGNTRSLVLLHATRVAIVVTTASMATRFIDTLGAQPFHPQPMFEPLADLPAVIVIGLVGLWGARRLGGPGASVIGPIAVSAVLHGTGLISAHPLYILIMAAQITIGAGLGAQFRNVTMVELFGPIFAGVVSTLVSFIPLVMAVVILAQFGLSPLSVLLAYSPGGQAEMNILALAVGADIAFISTHHITRVFMVILCTPLIRRVIERKEKPIGERGN